MRLFFSFSVASWWISFIFSLEKSLCLHSKNAAVLLISVLFNSKNSLYFYVCVCFACMSVHQVYAVSVEERKGHWNTQDWVTEACELLCGWWEPRAASGALDSWVLHSLRHCLFHTTSSSPQNFCWASRLAPLCVTSSFFFFCAIFTLLFF